MPCFSKNDLNSLLVIMRIPVHQSLVHTKMQIELYFPAYFPVELTYCSTLPPMQANLEETNELKIPIVTLTQHSTRNRSMDFRWL